MRMRERQRRAIALGAIGAGALLAARPWRRKPYDFGGKSIGSRADRGAWAS